MRLKSGRRDSLWRDSKNLNPEPVDSRCCWPDCEKSVSALPICWGHALESYRVVVSTATGFMDLAIQRTQERARPARPGYVYFVKFADRIKIGFTTDVTTRMQSIPHDEVLGIFPGTRLNERQLHTAFADLRITGEWFQLDDRILDFVADVKDMAGAT